MVNQEPYLNVSQEEEGPLEEKQVEVPLTLTQRKIQLIAKPIDLGMSELNLFIKDLGHANFDLSAVLMYQLYMIHHVVVEEMKTIERVILGQPNTPNNTIL